MALSSVSASTSAQQALAQDGGRVGLILQNVGTNPAYVLIGPGTVTAASGGYSFSLAGTDGPVSLPGCREQVSVIWGTAAGEKLAVTTY